jgi:hypothetical protein
MNADELRALAERVQGLDGPCEVTDGVIFWTLWPRGGFDMPADFPLVPTHPATIVPRFTASLDAAMTLVPDGWCWCAADYKGEANPAVWQGRYQNAKGFASLTALDDAMTNIRTHAATPALALTAAALLARAINGDNNER